MSGIAINETVDTDLSKFIKDRKQVMDTPATVIIGWPETLPPNLLEEYKKIISEQGEQG